MKIGNFNPEKRNTVGNFIRKYNKNTHGIKLQRILSIT